MLELDDLLTATASVTSAWGEPLVVVQQLWKPGLDTFQVIDPLAGLVNGASQLNHPMGG